MSTSAGAPGGGFSSSPNIGAAAMSAAPDAGGDQVIASYRDYADAQRAVDSLSDQNFPVESLRIVGSDLQLVEQVTGRLTTGRAALAGAGSGALLGLLFGLLVGLFTPGPVWLGLLLGGLVFGAAWGASLGFLVHWASGGRRDFSSASSLSARRYEIVADHRYAAEARRLLARTG